jgi:hypothetical protein
MRQRQKKKKPFSLLNATAPVRNLLERLMTKGHCHG